jgi:hypothetical protein
VPMEEEEEEEEEEPHRPYFKINFTVTPTHISNNFTCPMRFLLPKFIE